VLAARGWEMVRRPTGGRAILHTDELTYSVVGPYSEPRLMGSVIESYRVLAQALLHALHLVGIAAQAKEKPVTLPVAAPTGAPVDPRQNPVCFEVPSSYEITANGKKLFGSAQARRKEGVLQHGSLPLYGDLTRITEVLVFPTPAERREAAQRLLGRAVTAEQALGAPLAWETAAQALRQAFEESLNLKLLPAELSPAEAARAEQLMTEKYANPEWVGRM
jgi:lipoyl(octanoyl) transferase